MGIHQRSGVGGSAVESASERIEMRMTDLATLKANPPKRMGSKGPNGWSGESEASFQARVEAWRVAVERAKANA